MQSSNQKSTITSEEKRLRKEASEKFALSKAQKNSFFCKQVAGKEAWIDEYVKNERIEYPALSTPPEKEKTQRDFSFNIF